MHVRLTSQGSCNANTSSSPAKTRYLLYLLNAYELGKLELCLGSWYPVTGSPISTFSMFLCPGGYETCGLFVVLQVLQVDTGWIATEQDDLDLWLQIAVA